MSTIFDVLHEDHERVAQLLKEIEKSPANENRKRVELVEEVHRDLEMHTQFEETEVYPAIQKALGQEGELKHAVKEHREAMALLESVTKALKKSDSDWKEELKELKTAIEHHVAEEENELFPQARGKVSQSKAEKLASQYRSIKKKVAAE